jgi:outer membrane protein assembly factor BamB
MFRKFAICLAFVLVGCSGTKEDLSPQEGKYFIRALGDNIDSKDLIPSVSVKNIKLDRGSAEYRSGSFEVKTSEIKTHNIGGSSNSDVSIFSEVESALKGNIVVNDRGQITLLDKDLKAIWQVNFFQNKSFCSNTSIAAKDGIAVASCGTNILKAFDLNNNGKVIWEKELDVAINSKPLIVQDKVVVFSKTDAAYCVELQSGKVQWVIPSIVNTNHRTISATRPIAFGDSIVQQTATDQIRAINIMRGDIEWISSGANTTEFVKGKDFMNEYGVFAFDPSDSSIYFNNSDGFIIKIKLGSNKPDWMIPMVSSKPVWLLNDRVIILNDVGALICVSKANGEVLWRNNLYEKLLGAQKKSKFFRSSYNDILLSTPIVLNGKIFIVSSDRRSISVDPMTGNIIEIKKVDKSIFGKSTVINEKVYIVTKNGNKIIEF